MKWGALSLGFLGLWVVLQTTKGPLAEKLGLIFSGPSNPDTVVPGGPSTAQGGGPSVFKPASPPPNAPPGKYRVDQNGNWQTFVGGAWVPYAVGSPGYA